MKQNVMSLLFFSFFLTAKRINPDPKDTVIK